MNTLTAVSVALGIVVGLTTILSALWKIFTLVSEIKLSVTKVSHELERQELIVNGVRERLEHVTLRLQNGQKSIEENVQDVEAFLCKTTAYTIRR